MATRTRKAAVPYGYEASKFPAFLGTTFTIAELRAVYEAIGGVQLDAANFRRSLVGEEGWVIPTGRTARRAGRRQAR